jgi:hypothetical protein
VAEHAAAAVDDVAGPLAQPAMAREELLAPGPGEEAQIL